MSPKGIRHRTRALEPVLKLAVLAAFLLVLTITAGVARAAPVAEAEVAVYYFHGTLRCETCLLIEALAEGTLHAEFSRELNNGRLVWRPICVDLPENAHFVKDFDLGANELVVLGRSGNGGATWEKVSDIWILAAEPPRFSQRLREVVVRFLGTGK